MSGQATSFVNPSTRRQRSLFPSEELRYWGHYTDAHGDPAELDHAHIDQNIRRLKDSGADRYPFTSNNANRAWLDIVCLSDALVRWYQNLCRTWWPTPLGAPLST